MGFTEGTFTLIKLLLARRIRSEGCCLLGCGALWFGSWVSVFQNMQPWFCVRRLPQRWRPMFLWKFNTYLPIYIVLQYHLSIKLHSITVSPIYQTAVHCHSVTHLWNCSVSILPGYQTTQRVIVSPIKLHSVTASTIKLAGVTVSPIKLHSVTFTSQKKGVLIVISITVSDCIDIYN